MENKPKLTICILAKNELCALTAGCFFNLVHSEILNSKITLIQTFCMDQSDLPKARSQQVSDWYKKSKKGDLFMFIDSDQTFTPENIIQSLEYTQTNDIVCGAYARKNATLTVEPKNVITFYKNKFGELWYGSTGFMMFTFDIVEKIIQEVGGPLKISNTSEAYPLFFERIVSEPELGRKDLWLGEDYSFCWIARQCGGKIFGYISDTIGHILSIEKFCTYPIISKWPEKSIVVFCGTTAEAWSPKSLEKGLGGSETAIIKLTRIWAKKGYSVTVFCNCNAPGVYDDVVYRNDSEFSPFHDYDIFIIWRNPEMASTIDITAKKCFLDLHDIIKPEQITPCLLKNITKICTKSKFHASLLGNVPEDKVAVIPNGGAFEIEVKEVEKDPNYLIYASSYDRGLAYILKWAWPKIKEACPDAYLNIYYGWNGFDANNPKTEDVKLYKDIVIKLMEQPGVKECGRISQEELMKEKAKANIHLYTGDFQEIDCISVRESACVGAIPVVSKEVSVFTEKPYCITVEGNPRTKLMQENAAKTVIDIINNPEIANNLRKNIPKTETWEYTACEWIKLFEN